MAKKMGEQTTFFEIMEEDKKEQYAKAFSSHLRQLRSSMNMTQVQFAEHIHTTQTTLSSYENLGKIPSLDVAITIAKECNVSIDWLCGLSENKELSPQINTYKKFFKLLIEFLSVEYYTDNIEDNEHTHPIFLNKEGIDNNYKAFPLLLSYDSPTIKFLTDWEKIYNLFLSNTIDKELYMLWLNKELNKYDIPINGESF